MAEEIKLSDELMNQMLQVSRKEFSHKTQDSRVTFDSAGTLHLKGLDEEGQVVDDITFSNNPDDYKVGLENKEYAEEYNRMHKENKKINNGIVVLIGLLTILSLLSFWLLRLLV